MAIEITVATPTGKTVHVKLESFGACLNENPSFAVSVPSMNLSSRAYAMMSLIKPQQGATHYLDCSPKIGLGAEAAAIVMAAIAQHREEWMKSPEGIKKARQTEREDLVCAWRGIGDAIDAAQERAYRIDTGAGFDKINKLRKEQAEARAALIAWDEAHADFTADRKAQEKRDSDSFLASN